MHMTHGDYTEMELDHHHDHDCELDCTEFKCEYPYIKKNER